MQFLRSKHTQTIRKLDLNESANFDSDESCVLLAELLSNAPHMNYCDIMGQTGERMVEVKIEYAQTEEEFDYEQGKNVHVLIKTGTIKVVNRRGQVITEITTRKNEIENKIEIKQD